MVLMRKAIEKISLETPLYPAPHWSTLKEYGGKSTIKEFRKNLTKVRVIPENLRLYPVGFNVFNEKRKTILNRKPRKRNIVFDVKERMPSKKANKLYKTNFSHVKLKLKKVGSKTKKLNQNQKKRKKSKLKL